MTNDDMLGAGCALASILLIVLAAIGWVLNIVKIFAGLSDPITGMWLMRVIGAFIVPIGCIVGWL